MTRAQRLTVGLGAVAAIAAGAALITRQAAAQADPWRSLGGMNGVELYSYRDGAVTCYVSSAGGVSCVRK